METTDVLGLVSRIYDTTLDQELWPSVLRDVARATGASGAMIFELTQSHGVQKIDCPHISENYDRIAVNDYLRKHNAQEIEDQLAFARISGVSEKIELVDDTDFDIPQDALSAQYNVQDMMKFGLRHRSGTLLNKDSWQIDRFSLQYNKDRGPSTAGEKKLAATILPHVAKALRIGRPLTKNLVLSAALGRHVENLNFGICLLAPDGHPIATNVEFDRIVDQMPVFKYTKSGKLVLAAQDREDKYNSLISDSGSHGKTGAYPRRQSLFFPLTDMETGVFVEICPVFENDQFGQIPKNTRLITVMDSVTSKTIQSDVVSRFFPLSQSEAAVLELIGTGRTNREVAEIRNRSFETVNSQVKSLLLKTHTSNRTELMQLSLSLAASFP